MDVLFPFGHGLSYTQFEYSNLQLDKESILDTDSVIVTVDIKNTGKLTGREVVQLYVSPQGGEISRPMQELRGFDSVLLEPGEIVNVCFALDKRSFAYYSEVLHDWHVETTDYAIRIGSSSRDIRLTANVHIQSTVELPMSFTQYSSIGQVLKSSKGRAVLAPVLQAMQARAAENREGTDKAMGEGADEMRQAMMIQMPLQSLVGFGLFPDDKLQEIIMVLNS